jgi:(p)ppGpp synthase/HD superfamily hydrolase
MLLSLPFKRVESEVRLKLESMLTLPDLLVHGCVSLASERLGEVGSSELDRLVKIVSAQQSATRHHPSMRAYLGHPLRVTRYVLLLSPVPSVHTAAVALLHNLFEISGLEEDELLRWGLRNEVTADIRMLTIDRSRESDVAYLKDFYSAIEAAGPSLALIRCVDKLDNLLGAQVVDDEGYRRNYIELADRFVTPMAARLDNGFGSYFSSVCAFARQAPYLSQHKAQLDAFIKRLEISV